MVLNEIKESAISEQDLTGICYSYHFRTNVALNEKQFMDINIDLIKKALYDAILRDFKVELYSKIYEEKKVDVLIKHIEGLI